jgi:hypothetical protein
MNQAHYLHHHLLDRSCTAGTPPPFTMFPLVSNLYVFSLGFIVLYVTICLPPTPCIVLGIAKCCGVVLWLLCSEF